MFSPLEQFSLGVFFSDRIALLPATKYFYNPLNNVWLTIDNLVAFSILITLMICVIGLFSTMRIKLIPTALQYIMETIYKFLYATLVQQAGIESIFFFPMIMTLFFFILFSNLAGLSNWSYTITAHLIVTFFLALSLNLALLIYGVYKKRLDFFKMFNPRGVPIFLRPLTISIEVFSYILRNFSLPIRLFANMLAGHILLAIICSSFLTTASLASQTEIPLILFILDVGAVFAIITLEVAVAFIQAYVFSVLTAVYLRDSLASGH